MQLNPGSVPVASAAGISVINGKGKKHLWLKRQLLWLLFLYSHRSFTKFGNDQQNTLFSGPHKLNPLPFPSYHSLPGPLSSLSCPNPPQKCQLETARNEPNLNAMTTSPPQVISHKCTSDNLNFQYFKFSPFPLKAWIIGNLLEHSQIETPAYPSFLFQAKATQAQSESSSLIRRCEIEFLRDFVWELRFWPISL